MIPSGGWDFAARCYLMYNWFSEKKVGTAFNSAKQLVVITDLGYMECNNFVAIFLCQIKYFWREG